MEKRRLRRSSGSTLGEIALQLDQDSSAHKAIVRDFTVQGMAVVTDRVAPQGKRITIHILHHRRTVMLDAQVKHAKQIETGRWLLGCQLDRLLSTADVLGA